MRECEKAKSLPLNHGNGYPYFNLASMKAVLVAFIIPALVTDVVVLVLDDDEMTSDASRSMLSTEAISDSGRQSTHKSPFPKPIKSLM